MLECNKRQKVVKQGGSLIILRCINRRCEVFGNSVTEEVCDHCPSRSVKHVRPCKKMSMPPVPPPSNSRMSEEELVDLLNDSPLHDFKVDADSPDVSSPEYPKLSLQVYLYKEAVLKWNRAGRPVRCEEEIAAIHTSHCLPCSWYDAEKSRCKGCGCKVSMGSIAVLNKIKMATEHCPRDLW